MDYEIRLYTSEGEFTHRTDVPVLPSSEFIPAKNSLGQKIYVNRNTILFYKVIEHETKPFNS